MKLTSLGVTDFCICLVYSSFHVRLSKCVSFQIINNMLEFWEMFLQQELVLTTGTVCQEASSALH